MLEGAGEEQFREVGACGRQRGGAGFSLEERARSLSHSPREVPGPWRGCWCAVHTVLEQRVSVRVCFGGHRAYGHGGSHLKIKSLFFFPPECSLLHLPPGVLV